MSRRFWVLGILMGLIVRAAAGEPWTLERAIEQALKNSPDARVAQHRIAAARALVQQSTAGFAPSIQFNASYLRTDNPMMVLGSALNQGVFGELFATGQLLDTGLEADNLNLNGTVVLPIFSGGQSMAGRKAALAGTEAARQAAEAVRQTLAFEVARAFQTVRKTREFIRATDAAVQAFESNLAIARKRYQTGTALKNEVLDVEVRLAQAREDVVRARNAQALVLRALRNLLGIEEQDFQVSDHVPAMALPPTRETSLRPEVIAAAWQTSAAEQSLRRAMGGFLPQVNAFGRYDHDEGWKLDGDGDSFSGGVQVQWNLFDGNRTRGLVKEAKARLDAAREEERKLRLAVDLELQQAHLYVREAQERLLVTETAVAQAAESAQLTRARFEQGLALATQVIDSETALTGARVRRAEAEADREIAVAALRRALGLGQLASETSQP